MIKKILLLLMVLMAFLPPSLSARDFEYNRITYTVINEITKTCSTKSGTSTTPGNEVTNELVLPEHPMDGENEYTLVEIGENSFWYCRELTTVEIPATVTSIGENAFYNCSGLTSVTLPDGVTSIGSAAFSCCYGLTSITIPYCVTSIGLNAFAGCIKLTEINYNTVEPKIFSEDIFSDSHYADATLYVAKGGLDKAKTTSPWKNFTKIYESHDEKDFVYEGITYTIINEVLRTCETKSGASYDTGDISHGNNINGDVELPRKPKKDGVEYTLVRIGDYAFAGCSDLTSITIPDGVTSIGSNAFYGCSRLTSIILPDGMTSIGTSAFYDCWGLTSIEIPESVTSIGSGSFYGCSRLTSITIPDGVTSIGQVTFHGCVGLTSITLPANLISIDRSAFYYCTGLTSITIPSNVNSISWNAFEGCENLTEIYYNTKEPKACDDAFPATIYENATLYVAKDGLDKAKATFPWKKFSNIYESHGEIDFVYEGIIYTIIDENAKICETKSGTHYDPSSYPIPGNNISGDLELPGKPKKDGVEYTLVRIGDYGFSACSSLTSITIPNGVTSIGDNAFYGCSGLISITIPGSVTSIGEKAFQDCTGLTKIHYNTTEPKTFSEDLFSAINYENATLYVAKGGLENAQQTVPWKNFNNIVERQFVEGISFETAEPKVVVNRNSKLSANIEPTNADVKDLVWSSNDESIVTVDGDGQLSSIAPGKATITVAATDGSGVKTQIEVEVFALGDTNFDRVIDIPDAMAIANYSVGNKVENFSPEAGDVNNSGDVTIADASATIKLILEQPVSKPEESSDASMSKVRIMSNRNRTDDVLLVSNYSGYIGETIGIGVGLDSNVDYVAIQADIYVPEGVTFESIVTGSGASAHTLISKQVDEHIYRVVLYDFSNKVFAAGKDNLLRLNIVLSEDATEDIVFYNIVASDAKGQKHILRSIGGHRDDISGIENVGKESIDVCPVNGKIVVNGASGSEISIFTISGQVVDRFMAQSDMESRDVAQGIYIVVVGNRAIKVIVR